MVHDRFLLNPLYKIELPSNNAHIHFKKSKRKGNGNEIKGLILLLNTKLLLPLGRMTMVWRNPELIHSICEGFMIHLPAASRPINQSTRQMKDGESN